MHWQEHQSDGNDESNTADCTEFRSRARQSREGLEYVQYVVCETKGLLCQIEATEQGLAPCGLRTLPIYETLHYDLDFLLFGLRILTLSH